MLGLDDVLVDEVRDGRGFADEVIDELFLIGVILSNDLDGDALDEVARAQLFGFIDHAHAAFKNFADNLVSEIAFYCEQRHRKGMVVKSRSMSSLRLRVRGWQSANKPSKYCYFLLARS